MANVYKAPGTIYLQVEPDWTPESDYPQFEGVTWSVDRMNDSDVLYIRAPDPAALEQEGLAETLTDIRATARTGLPVRGMTEEQWAKHRLNVIASRLTRLIEKLETE